MDEKIREVVKFYLYLYEKTGMIDFYHRDDRRKAYSIYKLCKEIINSKENIDDKK